MHWSILIEKQEILLWDLWHLLHVLWKKLFFFVYFDLKWNRIFYGHYKWKLTQTKLNILNLGVLLNIRKKNIWSKELVYKKLLNIANSKMATRSVTPARTPLSSQNRIRDYSSLSQNIDMVTPSIKSQEVEKTLQIWQLTPEVTTYSMIDENFGYLKSGLLKKELCKVSCVALTFFFVRWSLFKKGEVLDFKNFITCARLPAIRIFTIMHEIFATGHIALITINQPLVRIFFKGFL